MFVGYINSESSHSCAGFSPVWVHMAQRELSAYHHPNSEIMFVITTRFGQWITSASTSSSECPWRSCFYEINRLLDVIPAICFMACSHDSTTFSWLWGLMHGANGKCLTSTWQVHDLMTICSLGIPLWWSPIMSKINFSLSRLMTTSSQVNLFVGQADHIFVQLHPICRGRNVVVGPCASGINDTDVARVIH